MGEIEHDWASACLDLLFVEVSGLDELTQREPRSISVEETPAFAIHLALSERIWEILQSVEQRPRTRHLGAPPYREHAARMMLRVRAPADGTLQCILNCMVRDMNAVEAVDAPRLHHQWVPEVVQFEEAWTERDVMEQLERRGHEVGRRRHVGKVQLLLVTEEGIEAVSDPRKGGAPAGIGRRP